MIHRLGIHQDVPRVALEAATIDLATESQAWCIAELERFAEHESLRMIPDTLKTRHFYQKWVPGDPEDPEDTGTYIAATEKDYDTLRIEVQGDAE